MSTQGKSTGASNTDIDYVTGKYGSDTSNTDLLNQMLDDTGCVLRLTGDENLDDFNNAELHAIQLCEEVAITMPDGVPIPDGQSNYVLDADGNILGYEITINGTHYAYYGDDDYSQAYPLMDVVYDPQLIAMRAQQTGGDVIYALNNDPNKPESLTFIDDGGGNIVAVRSTPIPSDTFDMQVAACQPSSDSTGVLLTNTDDFNSVVDASIDQRGTGLYHLYDATGARGETFYAVYMPNWDGTRVQQYQGESAEGQFDTVYFNEYYNLGSVSQIIEGSGNRILSGEDLALGGSNILGEPPNDVPYHTPFQKYGTMTGMWDTDRIQTEYGYAQLTEQIERHRQVIAGATEDALDGTYGGYINGLEINYDGETAYISLPDVEDGALQRYTTRTPVNPNDMDLIRKLYFYDDSDGYYALNADGTTTYISPQETVTYTGGKLLAIGDENFTTPAEAGAKVDSAFYHDVDANVDGKYDKFNFQRYIDSNIKGGIFGEKATRYTQLEPITDDEGNIIAYNLIADNITIRMDTDDFINYEDSEVVQAFIDATNLELAYQNRDEDFGQDVTVIPRKNANGEIEYYYYINGQEFKASNLDEVKEGLQLEHEEKPNYSTYNNKLSRKRNKSISDVDEVVYNEMIGELKDCNLPDIVEKVPTAQEKLSEYGDVSCLSGVGTSAADTLTDFSLLAKLIDGVVNLYIQCDFYMREILDGLLTGEEVKNENGYVHAKGSFVDYVFEMRNSENKAELLVTEEFRNQFVAEYNAYVGNARNVANNINEYVKKGVFVGDNDGALLYFKEHGIKVVNGYVDAEAFVNKFEGDITKAFTNQIQVGDDPALDTYVLAPLQDYMKGIGILTEYHTELESIKDMEYLSKNHVIDHIFDTDYRKKLEEVRSEGVDTGFMTQSEYAMKLYLGRDSVSDEKINERKGRYEAAKTGYDRATSANGWDDFFDGLGEGTTKAFRDIGHLIHPENNVTDWKNYYLGQYAVDCLTASAHDIYDQYMSGDITYEEYKARIAVKEDMDAGKGLFAQNSAWHDTGSTIGEAAYEMAEDLVLTYCTAGAGLALKPLLKGFSAGLKAAGQTNNSMYNSMAISDSAYIDGEYRLHVAATFGFTMMAVTGAEMLGAYFKAKGAKSTPSTPSTQSEVTATARSATASSSSRQGYKFIFVKEGFKELLEDNLPFMKHLSLKTMEATGKKVLTYDVKKLGQDVLKGALKKTVSNLPKLFYNSATDSTYMVITKTEEGFETKKVGKGYDLGERALSMLKGTGEKVAETLGVHNVVTSGVYNVAQGETFIEGWDDNWGASLVNTIATPIIKKSIVYKK